MKVAVFGHYDSRGGTAAFQVDEFTADAYTKAAKKYVEIFFCAEEDEMEEYLRVAEQDFLFFADLHGDVQKGDLEEIGNVLIDTTNEQDGETDLTKLIEGHPVQLEFIPMDFPENYSEEEALSMTKYLSGNKIETRSWNDDAYGFILYPLTSQ